MPLAASPRNIVTLRDGTRLVMYGEGRAAQLIRGTSLKASSSISDALDSAEDGTVIGKNQEKVIGEKREKIIAPTMINGRWTPLEKISPQAPAAWANGTQELLDTTRNGWILARNGVEPDFSYGAMLPLRLEGDPAAPVLGPKVAEAGGVDGMSIGSTAPGEPVKERIWIMGPSGGGETKVKLTTPIGPDTSLELSGNGLLFDGEATKSITGSETTFNLTADNGLAAGSEVPLVLTLKNGASSVESVSTPIAAKVMKKRTIRVRVWRVKSDSGALPAFNPTQAQLENYLNGVFQPQINAVFDCSMSSEIGPMNFDTAAGTDWGAPTNGPVTPGNGSLDFDPGYGHEMTAIRSGNYVSSFNINLYLVAVDNSKE